MRGIVKGETPPEFVFILAKLVMYARLNKLPDLPVLSAIPRSMPPKVRNHFAVSFDTGYPGHIHIFIINNN